MVKLLREGKFMLRCPKCQERIVKDGKRYVCNNNHSYDIAKQGYVNLILANQKSSVNAGDNVESLNARERFLNNNYYKPLADSLTSLLNKYFTDGSCFLDAGCGTGYYLEQLIKGEKRYFFYAVDISKKSVMITSKKCTSVTRFVGNVFRLPFEEGALMDDECLLSLFQQGVCQGNKKEDIFAVTPGKIIYFSLKK